MHPPGPELDEEKDVRETKESSHNAMEQGEQHGSSPSHLMKGDARRGLARDQIHGFCVWGSKTPITLVTCGFARSSAGQIGANRLP